jgi:hypothetical protein
MYIHFESEGDLNQLASIIQSLDANNQIQGIMVFSCDNNHFPISIFNSLLKNTKTTLFGGIFPSIIFKGKKHDVGSIVLGFDVTVTSQIIHHIDGPTSHIQDELKKFYGQIQHGKTVFINLDGLSNGVDTFKEEIFYTLGLSKNYIGGGAGSLSFERKPCVITNEGLLQDAAVLTLVNICSGIGVAHGWRNVSEPIKVTQADGNHIISLNWEPALYEYQKIVSSLSGKDFSNNSFFDIAKAYPFGISKMDSEMVVRDPIEIINKTTIVCVGSIPKNQFVYILNGNKKSLLAGAKKAKMLAQKAYAENLCMKNTKESVTLLIDCISRALFLEENFQEELNTINSKNLIGALTLGEIANTGRSYLEFYNKTSVIGILEG